MVMGTIIGTPPTTAIVTKRGMQVKVTNHYVTSVDYVKMKSRVK